jgi:hypothetical protein
MVNCFTLLSIPYCAVIRTCLFLSFVITFIFGVLQLAFFTLFNKFYFRSPLEDMLEPHASTSIFTVFFYLD